MIKTKNIKNMNIEEIEKHLVKYRYVLAFLLVFWIVISYIAVMYAYTFDPVLALAVSCFFIGLYTVVILQLYLYQKIYLLFRKATNQTEKEK